MTPSRTSDSPTICCHGGELTARCSTCHRLTDILACEEKPHLTPRRIHERTWGEPLPEMVQNPDLCLRCGAIDIQEAA